jgi:hypothetical protein
MPYHYSHTKKVVLAAQVEGEESHRYIKCDLDESRGHPIAVLFWPGSDGRYATMPLESSELCPSTDAEVDYTYLGNPIPIPKVLAEIERSASGLSDDGFRVGFFFLPENRVPL